MFSANTFLLYLKYTNILDILSLKIEQVLFTIQVSI